MLFIFIGSAASLAICLLGGAGVRDNWNQMMKENISCSGVVMLSVCAALFLAGVAALLAIVTMGT